MNIVFLATYILVEAADFCLDLLNLSHLRKKGGQVPPELAGFVDGALLAKTAAYNREHARLGMVSGAFGTAVTAAFLFSGAVALYDGWIAGLSGSFVLDGALFFLGLAVAGSIIGIPFSIFGTFVIEAKYGFNRKTRGVWLGDFLKSLLLSSVMVLALTSGALALISGFPGHWWLLVWFLFMAFQLGVLFVSPYLLKLFYKFKPIEGADDLVAEITALVEGAGIRLKGVFVVDSSKRTTHTNAFFAGLGRSRRIALFDTLIERLTKDEILAVLAHEVGHWKKGHNLKRIAVFSAGSLAALFIAFHLIEWGGLPELIGLEESSLYVQLVILSLIETMIAFPTRPLRKWLSRRNEREADRFAVRVTGKPGALADAMAKLSRDNLSNLHPHPLYAAFNYSHPPDAERIRTLRAMET